MTIGETFKQARKKMGLDLDEVAVKTKITKNFLEAIEGDELDRLPGEVYARHFLKIYSRLVKIDEDIVISEYHQQYGVKPHSVAHQEQTRKDDADFKRERRRNIMIVTIIVLVLSLGTLIFLHFNGSFSLFGGAVTSDGGSPVPEPRVTLQTGPAKKTEPTESEDADAVKPSPAAVTGENVAGLETDLATEPSRSTDDVADQPVVASEASKVVEDSTDPEPGDDTGSGADESLLDMPLQGLDGITVVGDEAAELDNVFVISALENVRVEVFIDGVQKTNRLLKKGMVRAYPYGNYHTITVYDASKVSIQEGRELLRIPAREGAVLSLLDWQRGELQDRIESWAESPTEPAATEEQ